MDEIEPRYLAVPARIDRYPVTDPAMRAWALAQVAAAYRAELQAASAAASPTAATASTGEGGT